MHTRRHFFGAATAGLVPVTLMPATVPLLAQAPPVRATVKDDVLTQITAELARIHREASSPVPRGEHYRATAATLRVFAALNLDAEVRHALTETLAIRGRAWLLTMSVDAVEVTDRLGRFGLQLRSGDLGIGRRPWPDRERALAAMLAADFSFSASLRRLAVLLDLAGARLALGAAPGFIPAQYGYCDDWEEMLTYLEFGLVVLCVMGNVPGCIATAASIALRSGTR